MYHFTVPMALMNYVPIIFFGITAVVLLQDLYNKMFKGAYALLASGCVNVFLAGFGKATWKLLYAANICDFVALEEMFIPVNSLGLLFAGLGLVGMIVGKRKRVMLSVAPVAFTGSLPFIVMMTAGMGSMCVALSILAVKMKKKTVVILFVLSFVFAMGMGFLASQDVTQAWVNWAEQSINTISQGCLMAGVLLLHKAGLKDWQW